MSGRSLRMILRAVSAAVCVSAAFAGPSVSPSALNVNAGGSYGQCFSISASGSWTISANQGGQSNTWIVLVSSTSACYMIAENTSGSTLNGSITVTDSTGPTTVSVTQSPYPSSFNDTLTAPTTTTSYNSNTGVVTISSSATYGGGSDGGGGGFITFVFDLGYGYWGNNGCEIRYVPFWNLVYLADDAGDNPWLKWVQPAPWQSGSPISNHQCSFGPNDITVNVPGDTTASITITVHLAANSGQNPTGFVGNVAVYPFDYAVGAGTQYPNPNTIQSMSISSIGTPSTAQLSQPTPVGLSGSNEFQFVVTYKDTTGSAYLDDLILSVNNSDSVTFPNCQIMLWRPWSGIWYPPAVTADWLMWNDSGQLTGTPENDQCTLNTGSNQSTFTINGDDLTMTVTFDVTFGGTFAQSGTELYAFTITSDWSDQSPNWSTSNGPWLESPLLTEYIHLGTRVIATETGSASSGNGGNGQGQSVVAQPRGQRSAPVRFTISAPTR